ncbi:hypothetical protein HispidOSU_014999, partial [Sigmodon hispidus]
MSVTAQQWPLPSPLDAARFFSSSYWNYTRNYTRNYVTPTAIFKKPQVHDPERLTADRKLLGAAVLLTSHHPGTPSALEAVPGSSPPSVSLYDGACTPADSDHEVPFAAELLIKHPMLCGPLTLSAQGCRQSVPESGRSALYFFYNEGSLSRNFDGLRNEDIFYECAEIRVV